jgi:TRAP transporter 4TM/12TM fusion protein
MGAVAFIMAEMTGIPYAEIAIAAAIPALLYYLGIFVQVHLSAKRHGMRGLAPDEIPTIGRSVAGGWTFVIPLAALVGAIILGYSPTLTGLYAIGALVIILPLRKETWLGFKGLYLSLAEATVSMVPVAAACASAGLIVGAMSMTGLSQKFADVIVAMTGQDLFLSLVVAALVTIVLGLGLPTSTSYILAAVLTAPVLIKLGATVLSAHMFILYYAVLSGVSPPIAVAAYAAAAIAKDNPFAISMQASRFCIVAFLVPFSFAFNEALFLHGDILAIGWALFTAVIGVIVVGVGVEGYLDRPVSLLARFMFIAGGLLCFGPGPIYFGIGVAVTALAYLLHRVGLGGPRPNLTPA